MEALGKVSEKKGADGFGMRMVITTDRRGYKKAYWVKDEEPDELAEQGILVSPPNLDFLEWEEVKKSLHNTLVERGLFTWMDVQRAQSGVTAAILTAMKRRLISLYRNREVENV